MTWQPCLSSSSVALSAHTYDTSLASSASSVPLPFWSVPIVDVRTVTAVEVVLVVAIGVLVRTIGAIVVEVAFPVLGDVQAIVALKVDFVGIVVMLIRPVWAVDIGVTFPIQRHARTVGTREQLVVVTIIALVRLVRAILVSVYT